MNGGIQGAVFIPEKLTLLHFLMAPSGSLCAIGVTVSCPRAIWLQ